MRIIARKNIVAYFATHPLTRASLTHWLEVAENADWSSTIEVMADFSKAKTVTAERVRFEVAGGDHRMIVAFHFRRGIAFIKFIVKHAECDRIDDATVDPFCRIGNWIRSEGQRFGKRTGRTWRSRWTPDH